jgi:hypothetical protein
VEGAAAMKKRSWMDLVKQPELKKIWFLVMDADLRGMNLEGLSLLVLN